MVKVSHAEDVYMYIPSEEILLFFFDMNSNLLPAIPLNLLQIEQKKIKKNKREPAFNGFVSAK